MEATLPYNMNVREQDAQLSLEVAQPEFLGKYKAQGIALDELNN